MELESVAELIRKSIMARLEWEDKFFDTLGFWVEEWAKQASTIEAKVVKDWQKAIER